ncbi:MAG: helix-turn-helix transcriptional regulator [Pirellulaceae bacterium]|nr:helix-turn-helix transcriptional regulator [Pirellulaceae bacterium]
MSSLPHTLRGSELGILHLSAEHASAETGAGNSQSFAPHEPPQLAVLFVQDSPTADSAVSDFEAVADTDCGDRLGRSARDDAHGDSRVVAVNGIADDVTADNEPCDPGSTDARTPIASDLTVNAHASTTNLPIDAGARTSSASKANDDCGHNQPPDTAPRKLNRLAEVRTSQGLSEKSMCKRLGIDLAELRRMEDPMCDLSLSQMRKFQVALDVPLVDLLEDSGGLSRPVYERAQLVKVMKTAASIAECNLTPRVERLTQMLREQLIQLMPELSEITSWPQFGSRRNSGAVARILEQEIDVSRLRPND